MKKKTIICISLFVVFVVSLNTFALTPITTYTKGNYLVSVYKGSTSQIWAETGRGGHYYMKTPYSSTYDQAIGYANISSTTFNTANGTKVPFYGITIQTDNSTTVDFGVEHTNSAGAGTSNLSWKSLVHCQAKGSSPTPNEDYGLGTETYPDSQVGLIGFYIVLSQAASYDKITCYITYMTSSGSQIGQTIRTYTWGNKQLFTNSSGNGSSITVRWFREMSLLPQLNQTSDTPNDGSYFNGKWTSLSLHNKNTGAQVAWSESASNVEEAWSVKYNNIRTTLSLNSSGQTDTFSINNAQ